MAHLQFDVAKRQFAVAHNNGARARRFALDPVKAHWYSVYRCARLALHGHQTRAGTATALAFRAYRLQTHNTGDLA